MVELDKFVRGASLVFVFSMLANVAGMVVRVLLAQGYEPVVFGRIMVGYTLFNLLGTLSVWGLSTALAYYLPREDERSEQYGIILAATILGLVISVVVTGTAILFNEPLTSVVLGDTALSEFTIPFLLGIPLYVCLSIVVGAFRGYESVRLKTVSKDMFYNFAQVGLIAAFIFLGIKGQFVGFVYVLSAAGTVILSLSLLYTYYPPDNRRAFVVSPDRLIKYWKQMLLYSTPVILLTLSTWGLNYIDTFLIQILQGSANVGFYKAVYPLALSLITVLGSFGFLYLPSLSRLESEGKREEARKLYAVSTYIAFALTVAPFLGIMFFTTEVIGLLYPPSYTVAVVPLQLLSIGLFIEVVFGLNSASLNALDRTTANAMMTGLALITNIGLNIILIPPYGIAGAAAATAAALLLWNLLASAWLYYTEQLHPLSVFYFKGAITTLVLTATIYYATDQFFAVQTLQTLSQLGLLVTSGSLTLACNLVVLMNTLPSDVVDDISVFRRLKRIRAID